MLDLKILDICGKSAITCTFKKINTIMISLDLGHKSIQAGKDYFVVDSIWPRNPITFVNFTQKLEG